MKIVNANPPNYEKIVAAFPMVTTIYRPYFCYGDTIYNPGGAPLAPEKVVHESVHMMQQLEVGIEWWWDMYIADKAFRLQEEVDAYRMEYKEYCRLHKNREQRFVTLQNLAGQLAHELYGSLCTKAEAMAFIKNVS